MTDAMIGLDPVDAGELAKLLSQSADQIRLAGEGVGTSLQHACWRGPDNLAFRNRWPGHYTVLRRTAAELDHAASDVLRNIVTQEETSAIASPELTSSLINEHAIANELSWNANEFVALPVSAVAASAILATGRLLSAGVSLFSLGQLNLKLFEDGKAQAGQPLPVANKGEDKGNRPLLTKPQSISSIFQSVVDAYDAKNAPAAASGDVRIVKISHPDGSNSYTVNIPGTEDWGATGGNNGRDLTGDLKIIAGQSSTGMDEVRLAMQNAGIGPNDAVMLAGHSQGGMIAGALAANSDFMNQYKVTNVLAVGAPIDGMNIDPRVSVLSVVHAGDVVPKLDLAGLTADGGVPARVANVSQVTMQDPAIDAAALNSATASGGLLGRESYVAKINHDFRIYQTDLDEITKYPALLDYQNQSSMQQFIAKDGDTVTAVDVPVSRSNS